MTTVDEARAALRRNADHPTEPVDDALLDAFEVAIRAAALDEARAAVMEVLIPTTDDLAYASADKALGDALAAIDALREDADKTS